MPTSPFSKQIKSFIIGSCATALIIGGLSFTNAQVPAQWTPPAGNPSAANNTYAPVHTGPGMQTKDGSLGVGNIGSFSSVISGSGLLISEDMILSGVTSGSGLLASTGDLLVGEVGSVLGDPDGSAYVSGSVGIGSFNAGATSTDAELHIKDGTAKIETGNEGDGKVFTSDADGVGEWEEIADVISNRFYSKSSSFTVTSKSIPRVPGSGTVNYNSGDGIVACNDENDVVISGGAHCTYTSGSNLVISRPVLNVADPLTGGFLVDGWEAECIDSAVNVVVTCLAVN